MNPDRGGSPLPPAPTCGAKDHSTAKAYVIVLEKALDQDGWSQNQRRIINRKLNQWRLRAAGMDAYFERRGNIPGNPDGPPPTTATIIATRWRRKHQAERRNQGKALGFKEKLKAQELLDDKEHE